MTKKHFNDLAKRLYGLKPVYGCGGQVESDQYDGRLKQWEATVKEMASLCASHNGQFDRGRFYSACGYDG